MLRTQVRWLYTLEDISMRKNNWNDGDIKKLKKMYSQGKGWLEISEALGRTPDSVRMWYRNNVGETGKSGKLIDPEYISNNRPIVGLFDVETLPADAYVWRLYDENIGTEQVISSTGFLSWAGKFLNAPDVYSDVLTSKEALEKDDERITRSCWEFLHQCDVVVGHNIINFDSRVANTFFLKYDLPPLKYIMVDTLKLARKYFWFESNKMGYINRRLCIKEKIENEGFPLWRDCREGDSVALGRMLEYNKGDVLALEQLYYKFRPYITHFNVALYNEMEEWQCPVCGSQNLSAEGFYYTPAGKWQSIRCLDCKCISRAKNNMLNKYKKKSLLVNS